MRFSILSLHGKIKKERVIQKNQEAKIQSQVALAYGDGRVAFDYHTGLFLAADRRAGPSRRRVRGDLGCRRSYHAASSALRKHSLIGKGTKKSSRSIALRQCVSPLHFIAYNSCAVCRGSLKKLGRFILFAFLRGFETISLAFCSSLILCPSPQQA